MIKKSAFLQKKTQQKQLIQEQQKTKQIAIKLQKNIRAFLQRRYMLNSSNSHHHIKLAILMNQQVDCNKCQEVFNWLEDLNQTSKPDKNYYLSKFILKNMHKEELYLKCLDILSQKHNELLREIIFQKAEFLKVLEVKLHHKKAFKLLNLAAENLYNNQTLSSIHDKVLLYTILNQFQQGFIDNQSPYGSTVDLNIIKIILTHLSLRQVQVYENVNLQPLNHLLITFIKQLKSNISMQNEDKCSEQQLLSFWLDYFMRVGISKHQEIASKLIEQNRHLVNLVEDVELLQEIEQKLRSRQEIQDFSNEYLKYIKSLITHQFVIQLFISKQYKKIKQVLFSIIYDLNRLFEDRKLLFIRSLISSDRMLHSFMQNQEEMFYQALKMRLIPMDDQEFEQFSLFNADQWKTIVKRIIENAEGKIKRIGELQKNKMQVQTYIPFMKRNCEHLQLKTLVDLMNNLCKKNLRVKKFNPQIFIQNNLSQQLNTFLFGKSSRIEELLKSMPFIFSFQSRINKFKELIKDDKKNHNRTLFINSEDITISVRRGREFQDAFQACMNKDLRRKYKIVFYNQQGFQEEGIDGGGIIKQFINRVLKSSFSQQYGLFMETSLNEALPNPYSLYDIEYEFVGKLVGKAVYEGITIEQKFAQPFLNLVIGRQNTFQDLHYIDPDIYRGLLNIKNTTDDISQLQQTFVIYDKLPNGQAKYVDLLCPNKEVTYATKQVYVTQQNKLQFILSYSDFKCNKQIAQKSRLFRKGFLKVMKPEWLTMFSNQELNSIISGSHPDFDVNQLKYNIIFNGYNEKDQTIIYLWEVLTEMTLEEKSLFLLYITSCPRPPTLGFGSMNPKICIRREHDAGRLPTAVTCMNILKLPNYRNKQLLKSKLLYAIKAKAGFQFA